MAINNEFQQNLTMYMETLHPIIYVNHYDFNAIDAAIKSIANGYECYEFNNALGLVNFKTGSRVNSQLAYTHGLNGEENLIKFLDLMVNEGFSTPTILVLKDVHELLHKPSVVAYLRRIAENVLYSEGYECTVFILSNTLEIPREIEDYITILEIPLPSINEIKTQIQEYAQSADSPIDKQTLDEIAISFKGLNECQISQILNLAFFHDGELSRSDTEIILKEKEQFLKKSSMLESIRFKENINDIGGLEELKFWLRRKAEIFKNLDKAIKYGVDVPKGVMIIGMPGCGKSLSAKATADLFKVPLVRLDVGRLLGKYVGESEGNMRRALALAEGISPCVLWIDELEKAFSGIGSIGGASDITTRLFGQFLTWMQEKESPVFIVATANDISNLPPELLRKGRFDELFFVDLPNLAERESIIKIHLQKRKKFNSSIDLAKLASKTEGFNGADIESVVKDAIEISFVEHKTDLTTDDLLKVIHETNSISKTLQEKIKIIKETINKYKIKNASR